MKIQEIAREAGVSPATVSRVFANHPNIREEVREPGFRGRAEVRLPSAPLLEAAERRHRQSVPRDLPDPQLRRNGDFRAGARAFRARLPHRDAAAGQSRAARAHPLLRRGFDRHRRGGVRKLGGAFRRPAHRRRPRRPGRPRRDLLGPLRRKPGHGTRGRLPRRTRLPQGRHHHLRKTRNRQRGTAAGSRALRAPPLRAAGFGPGSCASPSPSPTSKRSAGS